MNAREELVEALTRAWAEVGGIRMLLKFSDVSDVELLPAGDYPNSKELWAGLLDRLEERGEVDKVLLRAVASLPDNDLLRLRVAAYLGSARSHAGARPAGTDDEPAPRPPRGSTASRWRAAALFFLLLSIVQGGLLVVVATRVRAPRVRTGFVEFPVEFVGDVSRSLLYASSPQANEQNWSTLDRLARQVQARCSLQEINRAPWGERYTEDRVSCATTLFNWALSQYLRRLEPLLDGGERPGSPRLHEAERDAGRAVLTEGVTAESLRGLLRAYARGYFADMPPEYQCGDPSSSDPRRVMNVLPARYEVDFAIYDMVALGNADTSAEAITHYASMLSTHCPSTGVRQSGYWKLVVLCTYGRGLPQIAHAAFCREASNHDQQMSLFVPACREFTTLESVRRRISADGGYPCGGARTGWVDFMVDPNHLPRRFFRPSSGPPSASPQVVGATPDAGPR
jgi:hypothetical protein